MMEAIAKMISWAKIAVPILPVIYIDMYIGDYMKELYLINIQNNIQNQFPTSTSFYAFLISNIIIIAVYLFLSGISHMNDEEIKKVKANRIVTNE